jgi:hypothetical protein
MGRKITMTGRFARYEEHRGANTMPSDDRDIRLEGEEAIYREYAYPSKKEQEAGEKGLEDRYNERGQEEQLLLTDHGEYIEPGMSVEEKLSPIFYNNEENVRQFLKEINGMSANDITDLVNRWVQDKRISDYGYSRKGELWAILYDEGLYDKSRQNWNRRVF